MSRAIYIYVTPFFPSPGRHYGSYGYDFVQALKRNSDFDVRVFVSGAGSDYDFEGCHVHCFPVKSLPSALFPFVFVRHNARSFMDAVARAGIRLDDVAVCHGNTATYAIYPLAIKRLNSHCLTVLHHHDLDGFGLRLGMFRHVWIHKVINFFIVRRLFDKLNCHVFISEASKNSTLRFPDTSWSYYEDYRRMGRGLGWFCPARIMNPIILWNGVDGKKFYKAASGKSCHKDGVFRVGCVGNFVEVKDHLNLIKAVHLLVGKIPGLTLEILGTNGVGSFYADAKKYVEDNGLSDVVKFLDNISQDEMPDCYRRWDLMVLPSYFEGFGCVFTEAWACGTPFITCAGQGMDDMIPEDERGLWLCKPRDPEDLAKKIEDYFRLRPAQHLVGEIDIDKLVARFFAQLESVRNAMIAQKKGE